MASYVEQIYSPRAPSKRALADAIAANKPLPIKRETVKIQLPMYAQSDILSAIETQDTKTLDFVVKLLNAQVILALKEQLKNEEVFRPHEQIDTELISQEAFTLQALADNYEAEDETFELTEEDMEAFNTSFIDTLTERYCQDPGVSRERVTIALTNASRIIRASFANVRYDADMLNKLARRLGDWFELLDNAKAQEFAPTFQYFNQVYEKCLRAIDRKKAKDAIEF